MRVVLVTGGQGRLASSIEGPLSRAGWAVVAKSRSELDITDASAVRSCVQTLRPDAILNLAAWTHADACEADPERAFLVNAEGVAHLRVAAAAAGAHLCHLSSDYVFDGRAHRPYREDDPAAPVSVYGRSKLAGEAEAGPSATVVRVAWISGRHGRSLVRSALDAGRDPSRRLRFVTDQQGSPTVGDDLAPALAHLLEHRIPGIFHAANAGSATPHDLACHVLLAAGLDPDRVEAITTAELRPARPAARPPYAVLDTARLATAGVAPLPPWRESVARLVHQMLADHPLTPVSRARSVLASRAS